MVFSFIISCMLFVGGAGKYSFYPRLGTISLDKSDVIAYIVMILILGTPFIVEGICGLIYIVRVKRTVIRFGTAQKPY